jgi:hypothetical protein
VKWRAARDGKFREALAATNVAAKAVRQAGIRDPQICPVKNYVTMREAFNKTLNCGRYVELTAQYHLAAAALTGAWRDAVQREVAGVDAAWRAAAGVKSCARGKGLEHVQDVCPGMVKGWAGSVPVVDRDWMGLPNISLKKTYP